MVESIRKGYKKTDIGVIPCDWKNYTIKDLISFSGGSQPPKTTFLKVKKANYIRLIQIRDYKSDKNITFIPEKLANKKCTSNDVMIGRYGPPIFQILRGIEGAYNVALIKAIPGELLDKEYMYYFLCQDKLFNFIELLSRRSSGQTGIDIIALNKYPVPLPPLPEQRAIATALTDTDNLITSIEKLIDKKKKIKQGTMQQLLTGQKRLSGFDSNSNRYKKSDICVIPYDWEMKKMSIIADVRDGTHDSPKYVEKGVMFITSKNIINGKIDFKDINYISEQDAILVNNRSKVDKYDILLSMIGTIGNIALIDFEPKFCIKNVALIKPYKNIVSPTFLFQLLKSQLFSRYLLNNLDGGIQKFISLGAIRNLNIIIPKFKEQQAIAKVLTDMDIEIEKLEQKLNKYKTIKQGMMQELLTGRIRLV